MTPLFSLNVAYLTRPEIGLYHLIRFNLSSQPNPTELTNQSNDNGSPVFRIRPLPLDEWDQMLLETKLTS